MMDAVFEYLPDSPSVPAPFISGDTSNNKVSKEAQKLRDEALLPKLKDPPPKIRTSVPTSPQPEAEKSVETQVEVESKKVVKDEISDQKLKEQESINRKLKEQEEARKRQSQKEAEIAAENATLEVLLEHLLEDCDSAVKMADDLQHKVMETTRTHISLLKTAMDDTYTILDKESQWQSVSVAFDNREDARKAAEDVVENTKSNFEKLRQAIDDGRKNTMTKKNKTLTTAQEKLNLLKTSFNKLQNEVAKVESESRVLSKYKDSVDKAKEQFKKEVESLTPEVKLGQGKKLTNDELNFLIAHAHKRIGQLQQQLAQLTSMEQQRLQQALSDQRDEDELITQARVRQEHDKMLNHLAVMKDKLEAENKVQFELELRRELARQTAAHSDHLQEVLKVQEQKLTDAFEREMHMRVIEDREKFSVELSGWIARLKGIEEAVEARAESEMVAREAQALWLSCVALNGAIRNGNESGETWEDQLKPLEVEIDAVFFAAKNNPFVCLVLDSIPEKAIKRGVYTEENLKERFERVNKVARRVAMIDDTGGSLMKFFWSYLQSKFIFNVQAEAESDNVNLDELDTFQICDKAKYWIEKNDIEQALRFMNLLTGESRRVAADWIEEARLLLETRQATYALMAFASSRGLGTIF
ncbi:hypothetical protein ACF0H5_009672 [Mactra antiquata]